jgi:hypothetical protein
MKLPAGNNRRNMKVQNVFYILPILFLTACGPATPTPVPALPDLTVTSAYISMVDVNGNCMDTYVLLTILVNQSSIPAYDVALVETATDQATQVQTLGAFERFVVYFPAEAPDGRYTVVADPENIISETDETNNSFSYLAPTPTPPVNCPPTQPADAAPTPVLPLATQQAVATSVPFSPPTLAPQVLNGLIYAAMNAAQIWKINSDGQAIVALQGTHAIFSPDGTQAIIESQGDFLLAEPMDNPGINITHTPDRLEIAPQWWVEQPSKIVFLSKGSNEAQEKGWNDTVAGYLSMMNKDGSESVILDDVPSYTVPALSPDGTTIAYDRSGAPMLYEIGKGLRPFDPRLYGYQPDGGAKFTSPSYSHFGRFLTWWVSEGNLQADREFSLLVFDLHAKTYSILHTYTPLGGTSGWVPNPVWNGNEGWIAYPTRGEVTFWDLWISHPDGSEVYRLGLATNPIWSPDQDHLLYVQWPPRPDSYLAASTSIIEVSTWNTQAGVLPSGSIPLAWIHPAYLNINYFPMFTPPSDWLTYIHPEFGYSIQYPPNAILEETANTLIIRMPIQPNTQMMEKSITLATQPDTIDNCYAFSPWEGKTLLNGVDLKFYGGKYWETGFDGGRFLLGNYALYSGGYCYTIRLKMTALSESSSMPVPAREDMDVEVLLQMISTLKAH